VSESRHVYVHVPFCARRCSYCDFAIAVRRQVPVAEFVRGIHREISARRLTSHEVDTIYLGGGTPSRLGGGGVAQLLDVLRETCAPRSDAEITIEVNPEDVSPDDARAWVAAGVNRVSLGVQSFSDAVLAWMHRVHDARAAVRAMSVLRDAGLQDVSVDLIFAVPASLERDWARCGAGARAHPNAHLALRPHGGIGYAARSLDRSRQRT
jgi:oxygen-independent coproporphyrinogen-3 oxidase